MFEMFDRTDIKAGKTALRSIRLGESEFGYWCTAWWPAFRLSSLLGRLLESEGPVARGVV
jgi:hypothetical protein